jgi:alpha-tubulin suppressor-like RCC1 family protein/glucan-binding YG repeat protein
MTDNTEAAGTETAAAAEAADGEDIAAAETRVDAEGSDSTSLSFSFNAKKIGNDNANVSVTGKLEVSLKTSLKCYKTKSSFYAELKFSYGGKLSASITGKAKGDLDLGAVGFVPVPGVYIDLDFAIRLEVSAKIELSAKMSGTVGMSVDKDEGIKNISSTPKLTAEVKGEVSVFLGLVLKPKMGIVSDKIAYMGMEATAGGEIKGKMVLGETDAGSGKKHDCKKCIDGDINAKYTVKYEAKLFDSDKWKFTYTLLDRTVKLYDWYYSFDYHSFGLTPCPHLSYKVTVSVADSAGKAVSGATVTGGEETATTQSDGRAIIYLPRGEQTVTARKTGVGSGSYNVTVFDAAKSLKITLKRESATGGGNSGGGNSGGGGGAFGGGDESAAGGVKMVSLGQSHSAAITTNGDLYTWGANYYGQLGNGTKISRSTTPVKIMSNVASVSLRNFHSAAITTSGDLYTWGDNTFGCLGDGTTTNSSKPVKIMSNIASVSLGDWHSAAITTSGDLYTWGNNCDGQLGDGTDTVSSKPVKIMSDVASVSLGNGHSAAITTNGDLYTWGTNTDGEIGDGTTTDRSTPVKIMSDVASVSLGNGHSAAITTNGDLYTWGTNTDGEIGDGTTTDRSTPVKIMSDVASVSLGYAHSAAITTNGDLYTWGYNQYGQLGDGTTTNRSTPVKIKSNVASVSLGYHHSAAITTSGDLYTWGSNFYGQLGNGTTTDSLVPIQITLSTTDASTTVNDSPEAVKTEVSASAAKTSTDTGTASFTDLQADAVYNFYVMKSKSAENPYDAENLLYISQVQSDSKGSLNVAYEAKAAADNADAFVVCMDTIDISGAKVKVPNLTYTGKEQYVEATVTLDGKTLTEGTDYELAGAYSATEAGSYQVSIEGIGAYSGTVPVTYSVTKQTTTATTKNGWVKNSNGSYSYYNSNVLVKDKWLKGTDGQIRYVNKQGVMVTNEFAFDGSYTYYLQADGSPMKDRLTYHPDGEHIIYFDSDGHEVFQNFQYCPSVGYTCYFDSQGYIYKDQITFVGDKVYYLDENGRMKQNEWFSFANGRDVGYAEADGTLRSNGFGYDPWGRVVFYHWNGMVARGLISDGAYYYSMDTTDGHYLGQFPVQ